MEPTHVPQLSTWGFAQAGLRPGEHSGHRGSPPSRGLQSLWHVDRGQGHQVGSRPSDGRHRGLEFVCLPPFLSVQAVTHPGPQPTSLQVRRPELTQAKFRFLSEEAGRAAWGPGGEAIPQLFLLRRKAGFQRNSWEPLASCLSTKPHSSRGSGGTDRHPPESPEHRAAPKEPRARPHLRSPSGVEPVRCGQAKKTWLAIRPQNPKDRKLPSGEETQTQGRMWPFRPSETPTPTKVWPITPA